VKKPNKTTQKNLFFIIEEVTKEFEKEIRSLMGALEEEDAW